MPRQWLSNKQFSLTQKRSIMTNQQLKAVLTAILVEGSLPYVMQQQNPALRDSEDAIVDKAITLSDKIISRIAEREQATMEA